MNKIQYKILECCYRNVCLEADIRTFLKLSDSEFNSAVDKLILLNFVIKTFKRIEITSAGRVYMENNKKFNETVY